MEEIIKKETMTSLEIAEVTGKQYAHIMRDIRKLLEQGGIRIQLWIDIVSASATQWWHKGYSDVPTYQKGCLILASDIDNLLESHRVY